MAQPPIEEPPRLSLSIDPASLHRLLQQAMQRVPNSSIAWPDGRVALTEAEAASACGVGRHVLRDARQAGLLSYVKVGKRVCYRREDLCDFLDRQSINAAKEPA